VVAEESSLATSGAEESGVEEQEKLAGAAKE